MLTADFIVRHVQHNERVHAAKERGIQRAGIRIGAFIRRRVRTDILKRTAGKGTRARVRRVKSGVRRKVQAVAKPGKPPIVRSRSPVASLKNIRFAYSPREQTVYIGPIDIGKRLRGSSERTAAGLLERGGSSTVSQWSPENSSIWSLGRVAKPGVKNRTARARYAAHPFMGPGLDKEVDAGTLGDSWEGVVY